MNTKYEIGKLLGGGSTSKVYELIDKQTRKHYAIKIYNNLSSDIGKNEIINYEYIMKVISNYTPCFTQTESIIEDIKICIIMPKLEGVFSDIYNYYPNLSSDDLLDCIVEIFYGVICSQKLNFSHNDIYINVMYDSVNYVRHYYINDKNIYIKSKFMLIVSDYGKSKIINDNNNDDLFKYDLKMLCKLFLDRYLKFPKEKYKNCLKIIHKLNDIVTSDKKLCGIHKEIIDYFLNDDTFASLRIYDSNIDETKIIRYQSL